MFDLLIQITFGWPFIILSLLVSLIGLIIKRHQYPLIGAALIFPFSAYLIGYPFLRGWSLLLPLCLIGSAWAVRRQKMLLAWLLILPPLLYIASWLPAALLST